MTGLRLLAFFSFVVSTTFTVAVAQDDLSALFERASPSVVTLQSFDSDGVPRQLGSGFVVGRETIATNLHVVHNAAIVEVKSGDGSVYYASALLRVDEDWDLAILSVNDLDADPLPLADDESIKVGLPIIAIGSPLGLENTLSTGIISGLRARAGFQELIQFTSAISVGSSGGPVLTNEGEIVGVTTLTSAVGQNINFAIPVRELRRLLDTVDRKQPEVDLLSGERDVQATLDKPKMVRREIESDCSAEDVDALSQTIASAVRVGGPLYNAGSSRRLNLPSGQLACYLIYEGAGYKLIHELENRCPIASNLLMKAIDQAQSSAVPVGEKAWVMRYAFDSLLGQPTQRAPRAGLPPVD